MYIYICIYMYICIYIYIFIFVDVDTYNRIDQSKYTINMVPILF